MASKDAGDKRTESQFGPREQHAETWGSKSYGMSKVGMSHDDMVQAQKEAEERHERELKNQ